jgi:hypothetical protein
MASFSEHLKAFKRLSDRGFGGYVVMTAEAGKAGLDTRFPIGQIVGLDAPITVRVRKLGQRSKTGYAAAFWQPAPNRLVNYIQQPSREPENRT